MFFGGGGKKIKVAIFKMEVFSSFVIYFLLSWTDVISREKRENKLLNYAFGALDNFCYLILLLAAVKNFVVCRLRIMVLHTWGSVFEHSMRSQG